MYEDSSLDQILVADIWGEEGKKKEKKILN